MKYQKIPKNILILNYIEDIKDKEKIMSHLSQVNIDFVEGDRKYDLVILCDYICKFNLKNTNTLSDSEIFFCRERMSYRVFLEGLSHYSKCDIRNGR